MNVTLLLVTVCVLLVFAGRASTDHICVACISLMLLTSSCVTNNLSGSDASVCKGQKLPAEA